MKIQILYSLLELKMAFMEKNPNWIGKTYKGYT